MDLNMKAIETAIALGFYNNMLLDNGVLDWVSYTLEIVEATANSHRFVCG